MSRTKEAREERLVSVVDVWEELTQRLVHEYVRDYHALKRGSALRDMTPLSEDRGLKCYFIDNDLRRMKENFYVYCKLLIAAQQEAESGGDSFAGYEPFLYGLLSDSPEIYDWLAKAELKHKNQVKTPHFTFHQFQLVMRRDDEGLRKTIAVMARQGSNRNRVLAQAGQDFFSLLLNQDVDGLQALIEDLAKIKSVNELESQFLAGFAVIHAKLCWYRGLEVKVRNSLVPMPLMPIKPLETYEIEYDFLRADWTPPPPPGIFAKAKRLFSGR